MRTRCINCGATLSLDALIANEGAREALAAAFKLSNQLGAATLRYLGLFRSSTRDLSLDRVARLLNELLPYIQSQTVVRNGVEFNAPTEAWIYAMNQAIEARDNGSLKLPLKTHGWLYEVVSSYKPPATSTGLVHSQFNNTNRNSSKTLAAVGALEARLKDVSS